MGKQLFDKISFKSKVARRIFSIFVFCSLVPLLTIAGVSFYYAASQLKNQAYERLRQQCKNQGYQIYEHLIQLENEIRAVGQEYLHGGLKDYVERPYNAVTREGSGYKRIFLIEPSDRIETLITNDTEEMNPIPPDLLLNSRRNEALISLKSEGERFPQLFMRLPLDPDHREKGYLVGEIHPLYLYGIGTEGALPPEVNMEVRQLDGEVLISSMVGNNLSEAFNEAYARNALSGRYKSQFNGISYINSYWSLFLRHRFGSPDWVIIFSQSGDSVMSPVFRFSYVFILLILLTFFFIVLLSLRSIRNRTVPIEILKKGAMRIANGEFGHQVTVTSRDEFEDLAETFNEMSLRLEKGQSMLLQAAKMSTFGQMAAGIVHEIGQPLSAISGYAQLMQQGLAPESHPNYLEIICREAQRMAKIISKFRVFSRASREKLQPVNLNEIVDSVSELLDHNLKIKSVRLELSKEDGIPLISGDIDALRQVFLNLMINAVDALEEKAAEDRWIKIDSHAGDGMVQVNISDNGCGIPVEIQQAVFDPFFTTKNEDKGTGLGLSIIESIVHKHGGKIILSSVVGEGTRFTLSFPAVKGSANVN